ncbi:type I-E CRISPR-associated protein Cse1/CasA [Pigmentiphaga sp. GD03639]|uniref:type I-E CRISPR-associated protein Cse1/CasA n=1 Tax=Pigmentiphaga sp. GD03639 TaxID=2975354 RepID=UPI00244910F7|nr:type I-E CRISPR-associated protein Cse1/CasA [Pigmentiphaga sp. GD03639]MDH2235401.1 type I-E CRISPR-associated protein Cse1/CasA [Pigmentiphaga sp. GD03639]
MSLLTDAWMPVRDRSGRRRWIAPSELTSPDLIAFDADRADFNGALAQFAIGLLSTHAPLNKARDWERWFASPPDASTLQSWWEGNIAYFTYDGDGARFMQDHALAAKADFGIAGLLIDSPGENAIKNNSDHFVKRGRIERLCPHCAMTALLTLQINAPAGGAGHRTGLRGGGPLTTLLACEPARSLWHDLWLNVMEPPERHAHGGDIKKSAPHFTFPWLAPVEAIQPDQGETSPVQTHPMHIFWAMPRRIRLDFDSTVEGTCDICHRTHSGLLTQYATAPYGFNYKGPWDHVLSPYYQLKGDWLPLHPQPGGFGYRHWLPWLVGVSDDKASQRPARVVAHFRTSRRERQAGATLSLWAFGFDMDNMKARCWYEARLPVYSLEDCGPSEIKRLQFTLQSWLAGARDSVYVLRSAVKTAWFSGEARGDYSAVDAAFWNRTEAAFYELLRQLIHAIRSGASDVDLEGLGQSWLNTLQQTNFALFDDVFVGAGAIDRSNPRRVAAANKLLRATMFGEKLRKTLNLPVEPAKPAANRQSKTQHEQEA